MPPDRAESLWMSRRDRGFPTWIAERLSPYASPPPGAAPGGGTDPGGVRRLKRNQEVVKEFMAGSPYRGVLVYHGLGAGKTCTAWAAASAEAAKGGGRVIVLLPASLQDGFASEMRRCAPGLAEERVSYANYNGRPGVDTERRTIGGHPVDGSVVVVDEVHNFIGEASSGGSRASRIYEALYRAVGAKLVLLSGTPAVNDPFEIALMLNLLSGPLRTLRLVRPRLARAEAEALLSRHPGVLSFRLEGGDAEVEPVADEGSGFEGAGGSLLRPGAASLESLGKELSRALDAGRYVSGERPLFPTDREAFHASYVSEGGASPGFVSRAVGMVSYYAPGAAERALGGYPEVDDGGYVALDMSDGQLSEYVRMRQEEIRMEGDSRRAAAMRGDEASGLYRAFSRAVCNFAFPDEIPRVFPSGYRRMLREMAASAPGGRDAAGAAPSARDGYSKKLREAMEALSGSDHLREPLLAERSPKMSAVLAAVSAPGAPLPALVYSQYREVEGIGIMSMVLRANGYEELVVQADGTISPSVDPSKPLFYAYGGRGAASAAALEVFNNSGPDAEARELDPSERQLKNLAWIRRRSEEHGFSAESPVAVIMVTKSGAEGLDLRGVRQVHVMEPFWNEVRVQQVVGRSARLGSHSHLGEGDQRVAVYRYVMRIPEARGPSNFALEGDEGLTSDQIIARRSAEKMKLVGAFFESLRRAAVDCGLYGDSGEPASECYRPAGSGVLFTPYKEYGASRAEVGRPPPPSPPDPGRVYSVRRHSGSGRLFVVDSDGGVYDYAAFFTGSRETLGSMSSPKPKPKAKTEPKPEPNTKPKPEAKTKPKPEAKTKPKPEAKTKPKPGPKTKPKPEAKTKPKPEAKPKAEPKPKNKTEPKTNPKMKTVKSNIKKN